MAYPTVRRLGWWSAGELLLARLPGDAGFCVVRQTRVLLPAEVRIFEEMADAAMTLPAHPGIAATLGRWQQDGVVSIASEAVFGGSGKELLEKSALRRTPLPLWAGVVMVRDAARALDVAHELRDGKGTRRPVVHKALLSNSLRADYQGVTKICDLLVEPAVLKLPGSDRVQTLGDRRRLRCMSPEQVRGELADLRSDVYSLGVILYELTTRKLPFGGTSSDIELLMAIRDGRVEPPRAVAPGYPIALEEIVQTAMATHPDRRYVSALELADALDEFLESAVLPAGQEELGAVVRSLCAD